MGETPLKKWSTPELERWLESKSFSRLGDRAEAKRILQERFAAPDRTRDAWMLALTVGCFAFAVLTYLVTAG